MRKLILIIALLITVGAVDNVSYAQSPEKWKQGIKNNNDNWKWLKNIGKTIFTSEDNTWLGAYYSYNRKIPWEISVDMFGDFGFGLSFEFGEDDVNDVETISISIGGVEENKEIYEEGFWFFSVAPHYKLKYLSIGCGLGGARTEYSNNKTKWSFMLRPEVRGYIPLFDNFMYVSIGIGYDYSFKHTYYNGVNFGIGIGFKMD